jgi:hypothetical protein
MTGIDHTRVHKLLSLALDSAAAPGEIDNATRMLVSHLRKAGAKADDLLKGGAGRIVVKERIVYRDRPVVKVVEKVVYKEGGGTAAPPPIIRMPFGKHKGVPVSDVDPGYLQWVLDNCTRIDAYLSAEIRRVLKLDEE